MTTLTFVEKHRIRAEVTLVDHNPHMVDDDWSRTANHWRVVLQRGKRQMTVPFSTGSALGEPTAARVLDCLASDAAGYENAGSFEEWAGELGYDPDSREAERTYKVVERQAEALRRFLGADLYDQLLYHTDRL